MGRRRSGERLTRRLRTSDRLTVAVFAVWAVMPVAALLAKARGEDGVWGGAWAALGPADQYRYLAWIRDAGDHLLISNQYALDPGAHVYLHPMFLLSGLAWKLGVSLQLAYLLWLPACVTLLAYGFRSYIARLLEEGWPRRAALVLALFFFTPLLPALDYSGVFDADAVSHAVIVAGAAVPYWQAWGYLATLAALGLVPLYLLGVEAVAAPARGSARRSVRWHASWAAAAGLGAAWLHPWAGLMLVLITVGVAIWDRLGPRTWPLLGPLLATMVPLAYYRVLQRSGGGWELSHLQLSYDPNRPLWALAFAFGPLLLLAAATLRGAGWPVQRRTLVLWPPAALAVYFLVSADAQLPALQGLSLPLAILAVQGWRRLRLPPSAAVGLILLSTLPGMAYSVHTLADFLRGGEVPYVLKRDDLAAVRAAARPPLEGRVLASPYIGTVVPAFSGRTPWVAFRGLDPAFSARYDQAESLLDGRLKATEARGLVAASRARYILADCLHRANLAARVAPAEVRRFGCATLYRLGGRP